MRFRRQLHGPCACCSWDHVQTGSVAGLPIPVNYEGVATAVAHETCASKIRKISMQPSKGDYWKLKNHGRGVASGGK